MNAGGCYCEDVRFEVAGEIRPVVYCHCSQCRKFSGHYFAASAAADGDLTIRGNLRWYESSPGFKRGFCPNCGTPLFWKRIGSAQTSILAGAFDEGTVLEAECHIFCKDKPGYYEIGDGLPQYEEYDP